MSFHVAQVGFFKPVLDGLHQAGANIDRLLNASGLDKFQLDDVENYVPVPAMYSFLEKTQSLEGVDDLLEVFAEQIQLTSLSQWGEMVAYTPDILSGLNLADKYDSVVLSHERAGYVIDGAITTYWQRYIDKPHKGREQTDFLDLALVINSFRLAAGKDWAPLEIHLQSHTAPNLDSLLPVGNKTKVLLGQPATAIKFPTAMLSMPMLGNSGSLQLTSEFLSPETLSSKLECLLESTHDGLLPSMKHIAEMTDMASRTLQRKLAEEGTTLSGVVDQWRFKKTIQLLQDPKQRVKDISQQLGYSNVPNFERAFRRWTKTTPSRYRNLQ